jgi:hypothetical protein
MSRGNWPRLRSSFLRNSDVSKDADAREKCVNQACWPKSPRRWHQQYRFQRVAIEMRSVRVLGGIKVNLDTPDPIEICGRT